MLVSVALLLPIPAVAQTVIELVFSSPPSPVGSGARAAGLGSAFIGVADDATAASWNPGGLTQLERPELSAVGRGMVQSDDLGRGELNTTLNDAEQTFRVEGENDEFSTIGLNYFSAAVPFSLLERNIVASLNYQQMLSFDRDLHFQTAVETPGAESLANSHIRQEGGVDAVTAALAVEIVPEFSVGAAINYWIDGLEHNFAWREVDDVNGSFELEDGTVIPFEGSQQDTFDHFRGVNATFGLLWKLDPRVSIGAVWKLPFVAHVHHRLRYLSDPAADLIVQKHRLEMQASYGVGVGFRPIDRLTISSDLTYVDWGQFRAVDSAGTEFLVTGDPASEFSVDGTFTPRLGVEYLWVIQGWSVAGRGGFFYDPEPSRGAPKPYYGGSMGLGLTFAALSLDFAYQLRFGLGAENTSTATQSLDVPATPLDTFQHQFYLSLIQYF